MENYRLENAAKRVNEYDRLCTAANIDLDIVNKNLNYLLEYRKKLAIEVLKNSDEKKKELTEVYFYVNAKIKALLAIE